MDCPNKVCSEHNLGFPDTYLEYVSSLLQTFARRRLNLELRAMYEFDISGLLLMRHVLPITCYLSVATLCKNICLLVSMLCCQVEDEWLWPNAANSCSWVALFHLAFSDKCIQAPHQFNRNLKAFACSMLHVCGNSWCGDYLTCNCDLLDLSFASLLLSFGSCLVLQSGCNRNVPCFSTMYFDVTNRNSLGSWLSSE